ncbi:MAG TPA: SBBP repeat-containing protein, partial [Chloroflexia bacterium]|nr:SBBP repeat-containing protein [Chloroflexia bacterium]
MRRKLLISLLGLSLLALLIPAGQRPASRPAAGGGRPLAPAPVQAAGRPLAFEPNAGQASAAARYLARGPGATLVFAAQGVMLQTECGTDQGMGIGGRGSGLRQRRQAPTAPARVPIAFVGARADAALTATDLLPGQVNYLRGPDPAQWHTHLPTYAALTYRDLFAGVDLEYRGQTGRLKGTYTVAPGADPAGIRWRYQGAPVALAADGSLEVTAACGTPGSQAAGGQDLGTGSDRPSKIQNPKSKIVEEPPVAWQAIGETRVPVAVQYTLAADGSVGFAVGAYDPTQPLIIDPTLVYATYLGGSGDERAAAIAVDASGAAYLGGYTTSSDFPLQNPWQPGYGGGAFDAVVVKLAPNGEDLVYATYLGGSGDDGATGLAVDGTGAVYLTGDTTSANFPLQNPWQPALHGSSDSFVLKLAPDGASLVFSTYLGGSNAESGGGLALDSSGAIYITGQTLSTDFPRQNALQPALSGYDDAFVTKLAPDGASLVYSTYLGGSGNDWGSSIAVDSSGAAALTGYTDSRDFPTANAAQPAAGGNYDTFVTRLNAAGSAYVYSTYLGGNGGDDPGGVALDA